MTQVEIRFTCKTVMEMNEQNQPPSEKHHSLGDTLAIVGLALTLITWALYPAIWMKGVAVLCATGLLIYLVYHSHFTRRASNRNKHISAVAIGFCVLVIGGFQLRGQWKSENQASPSNSDLTPQLNQLPLASTPLASITAPIPQELTPKRKKVIPYRNAHSRAESTIRGTNNTLVGSVSNGPIIGDGNTIVGATDANGNTVLNHGGTAIGRGATADSTSIAIGANARAGILASPVQQPTINIAPGGFATSGGYLDHPQINNFRNPLPNISWTPAEAERSQTQTVSIDLLGNFTTPAFGIKCDSPCLFVGQGILKGRILIDRGEGTPLQTDNPAVIGVSYNMGQMVRGTHLIFTIKSRDGVPFSVLDVYPLDLQK